MGECWRVVQNGEAKACKVITRGSDPARFEREVSAMQRIDSPRVVRVFGRGMLTTADDGADHPYLLSEFLPGGDVRQNITASGWPDDRQLRAFLIAVLEGVAELHKENVVHRDLKPENLLLLNGDWTQPVIIDLGLSRLVDLASVTVYPWAGGTWPYMAPEQAAGRARLRPQRRLGNRSHRRRACLPTTPFFARRAHFTAGLGRATEGRHGHSGQSSCRVA
jgi:serine/threonine protein kinase